MNSNPGFKRKTLAAFIGFAVVGLAGQAQAAAIAFSSNNISDFLISADAGTLSLGTGSLFTSAASATLTGEIGIADSDPQDVLQQALGSGYPGENEYAQTAPAAGNQFSRGDAIIDDPDVLGGTAAARNVAETQLNTSGTTGGNDASNSLNGELVLSEDAIVTFSFNSLPFMENTLDANAAVGSGTDAALVFSISLLSGDNTTEFLWAPDGSVFDTLLADETLDDASLNTTIDGVTPGVRTYDPVNGIGPFNCGGVACNYSASTVGALAAGTYELSITMLERSNAIFLQQQIPEPATLALLGLGLVGLGFSRRRKAAV